MVPRPSRRPAARVVRTGRLLAVLAVVWIQPGCARETTLALGKPVRVADGVLLYTLTDQELLDPPGPVSVRILRLDPDKVQLASALAQDHVMGLETVAGIAARHGALAAVNAGYFVVRNGDPTGVLKVHGELVSDASTVRGAVGILRQPGRPVRLLFDRVGAGVTLGYRIGDEELSAPIDGVDTTRVRNHLMLFTPRFGADSDTAAAGVEWQLGGKPLAVIDRREDAGKTPIPPDGAVLSYGGTILPLALERLGRGQEVALEVRFQTALGTLPEQWADAQDVIGGAGLLVHRGRLMQEWAEEKLRPGFDTERHPRTLIGTSANGTIWLVAVDGRNPQVGLGMTFLELQRLAAGLNLANALNLDGGGSTTMVVRGKTVNHPSDPAGPRKVSDALVVLERKPS